MKPFFFFILFGLSLVAVGQKRIDTYQIGDTVSGSFEAQLLNGECVTFHQLKGKPTILDFWNIWCAGCIASMPKMDSLQAYFGDRMQLFFVTKNSAAEVQNLFAKRRRWLPENIPMIVADSVLSQWFPYESVPHLIWINQHGVVSYITYSHNATRQNIEAFLQGKSIQMNQKIPLADLNPTMPIWRQNDQRIFNAVRSYSLFTDFLTGLQSGTTIQWEKDFIKRVRMINVPLIQFYVKAFGGLFQQKEIAADRVILEVENKDVFRFPNDLKLDEWLSANSFCYEATVPFLSETDVRKILQEDLRRNFPYDAIVERRWTPVYALIKKDSMLKRRQQSTSYSVRSDAKNNAIALRVATTSHLIALIKEANRSLELPLIDDSHYTQAVDLDLHSPLSDIPSLTAELQRYGFDIVQKVIELDMLIIRDKSQSIAKKNNRGK